MAQATLNPALRSDVFAEDRRNSYASGSRIISGDNTMTLNGTIGKCFVLLILLSASAVWVWHLFVTSHSQGAVMPFMWGGAIGGFVIAMITMFKRQAAPLTAPLYAVAEGFVLGSVSAFFQMQYPGIVIDAIGLTMAICAAMLLAYATRIIQPTRKFMLGITAATGGIMIFYLVTMVLGFFHIHVPLVFASGPVGIAFSLFVVVIAALNLVIDFGIIETGVSANAPKYMEWYGAFALMVTLVWLYLEVLRLLAKTRGRD